MRFTFHCSPALHLTTRHCLQAKWRLEPKVSPSLYLGVFEANDAAAAVNVVEAQLKDIVQNLYNLIVQPFDHQGSATQDAMKREMYAR